MSTVGGLDNAIQVANQLNQRVGVRVSPKTVYRTLKAAGLSAVAKVKKPRIDERMRRALWRIAPSKNFGVYDPYLTQKSKFWVKYGSNMGQIWVNSGSNMGQYGLNMGQFWVKYGSIWVKYGSIMGQLWVNMG
ncbi:hypothetical protein G6F68_015941 [Rhizopus microsporus]|nr:hypothetical protein G6F67_009674 [Rhizopus microsporus]KAG1243062.1 hypothetical protein G6F68_015941 [Rhizopus microsporus]